MSTPKLPPTPEWLANCSPHLRANVQAYARAAIEANTQAVPDCRVVDRGFRWDADRQEHVPTLVTEFDAVPFNSPYDAKGWTDRDALAAMLAAAPQPQPVAQPVQASDAATLAIDALEAAKDGLDWYRGVCPQHVAGDDDEMDQQIEAAIAALQGNPANQQKE